MITMTTMTTISTGNVAVAEQHWRTPSGHCTQYTITLTRPVAGAPYATEHTVHDDAEATLVALRAARNATIGQRNRARRVRESHFESAARHGTDYSPHADDMLRDDIQSATIGAIDHAVVALERHAAERIALAEDLARWAVEHAERTRDEDVASLPEGRHYTRCCEQAREDGARNEYAFAMELPLDQLRRRHSAELEERAVDRARREGVIR